MGAQEEPGYKVEVRLVQIEVRVSEDGEPVRGLTLDDFLLEEEGRPQSISFLRYVEPLVTGEAFTVNSLTVPEESLDSVQKEDVPPEIRWIYIATEVGNPYELGRATDAIRRFIGDQLPRNVRVSLGGLPFTDDFEVLNEIVDRMAESPYGQPSGISQAVMHASDLEFDRQIAKIQNEETAFIQSLTGKEFEPQFEGAMDQVPVTSVEAIDRRIIFFGQLAIYRYMNLVESLGRLPGKKVVILLRSGLRLDSQNYDIMTELAGRALRNRVSFFTIDSKGLEAFEPIKDRRYALAWHSARPESYFPNMLGEQTRKMESKEGLIAIAESTGGKVIFDTNDIYSVFDAAVENSGDYYVLGYYPSELEEDGGFRKIKVTVNRQGTEVEAPKGYFERKPLKKLSKSDRSLAMIRALDGGFGQSFDLSYNLSVFSRSDGQPVLVSSVGAELKRLTPELNGKKAKIKATVLTEVSDLQYRKMPYFHEQELEHELSREEWNRGSRDETVFLSHSSQTEVQPGVYRMKGLIWEERSNRLGVGSHSIMVPDFRQASTPSSLLLTRRIRPLSDLENVNGEGLARNVLVADGKVYLPQPENLFRQGEAIHVLYHLYRPTPEDIEYASKGMQLGLLREGVPVSGFSAFGKPIIDLEESVIRYTAVLDTRSLNPGRYKLLAILPNYQTRTIPHLEGEFVLRGRNAAEN